MWHWLMLHFVAYAIVQLVNGIQHYQHQQKQQLEESDMLPLLRRQRRYLIFEQGATIIVQGNIAKSILGAMPRGLNEINEWTLTYALPTSIEALRPKAKTTSTRRPLPTSNSWQYWQPTNDIFPQQKWLKKAYILSTKRPLVCPKRYPYGATILANSCKLNWQHGVAKKKQHHRLRRFSPNHKQGKHTLLLDLLTKLSELHVYQPRHCIMRILCESHHLLAPPGVSLFHDALRILMKYALPLLKSDIPYIKAYIQVNALHQCAELYGPHCRHSFLEFFTQVFHSFE